MDRRDEDIEGNAWPGFVDILSSVIIMFVFFVLIIAIILSILSIERVADEKLSSPDGEPVAAQMQQILDLLKSGEVTLEDVKESSLNKQRSEELAMHVADLEKEIQQIQIGLSNSDSAANEVIEEDRTLTVVFDRNAVIVGEGAAESITAFLDKFPSSKKIRIISSDNPNASYVSSSRKTNLARSFNIRNELIKNEWNQKNISIDFQHAEKINGGYDWVRIEVIE